MNLRSSLPLGILALAALALGAQGITLKRTPKVGDKAKYKTIGTLIAEGVDVVLTTTATEEVTKVEDDAVTTTSSIKTAINLMGQDNDLPDETGTFTTKLDGTVVSAMRGDKPSGPAGRLMILRMLVLPANPVAIGDSWTAEGKKDEKNGIPGYKYTYKLVAEEKVGDVDTYKITADGGETDGATPAKIKATYWIDKTTAMPVHSLVELTDAVLDPQYPPVSGKLDTTLQP